MASKQAATSSSLEPSLPVVPVLAAWLIPGGGHLLTISNRLIKHLMESNRSYGDCYFVFGQVDHFLSGLAQAPLVKFLGQSHKNILAKDLNQIQIEVIP